MDGQSDLSASIKPQEHRKISLFVSETGKYADEDNFRQKNPTKAEHTIESIDDYISATIGAIFKTKGNFMIQISDNIFMRILQNISHQIKTLGAMGRFPKSQ